MTLSEQAERLEECLLLGVKRTSVSGLLVRIIAQGRFQKSKQPGELSQMSSRSCDGGVSTWS